MKRLVAKGQDISLNISADEIGSIIDGDKGDIYIYAYSNGVPVFIAKQKVLDFAYISGNEDKK